LEAEIVVRIRGATTARRIPRHDGELVGQILELPPPLSAIAETTVQQHDRRSVAHPTIGDTERTDFNVFHHA
jgi:hypothetical protein